MTVTSRRLETWAFLSLLSLLSATSRAGEFDPVVYDLRDGSVLVDDCLCERPTISVPIRGSLVLTRLPVRIVGYLYSITEVNFRSDGSISDYAVAGSGRYYRRTEAEASLSLDLEVNGVSGIQLESGTIEAAVPFPAIDITAGEDSKRDPLHIYSVRLVAEPRAKPVLYKLVEGSLPDAKGSFLIDDCTICGRPTIMVPVGGTFILSPEDVGGPNPIDTYRVEALDVHSVSEALKYQVVGEGRYSWGGEVALLQEMELTVQVNDEAGIVLASGWVPFPQGVSFPAIDIALDQKDPQNPFHVYHLQLVARPVDVAEPVEFRRSDANGDGLADISDAVFTLLWLFDGGAVPGCLDAADSNDDGLHDLSDAVFTLDYLFRGGPAPPAPGPDDCGSAKDSLGCAAYGPCG